MIMLTESDRVVADLLEQQRQDRLRLRAVRQAEQEVHLIDVAVAALTGFLGTVALLVPEVRWWAVVTLVACVSGWLWIRPTWLLRLTEREENDAAVPDTTT